MPSERNAGIGSFLLRGLVDEAGRVGKVVRIYVESYNPSLRFFERLGFRQIEQHGIHLLLEWSPTAPGNDKPTAKAHSAARFEQV